MKKTFTIIFATTLLIVTYQPASGEGERRLSLQGAMRQAVVNNFDLAIQRIETKKATEKRKEAEAYFDPTVDAEVFQSQEKTPATSAFADPSVGETAHLGGSVGVSGILSPGTQYKVGLETGRDTTNSSYATLDPKYGTSIVMEATHPFLKGAGTKVNRWRIISGVADETIANMRLEAKVSDIITRTAEAYWNLTYSRGLLETENESLFLARDLLNRVKAQVEAGAMAQIEIIQAKTSVAERELLVIEAKTQLEKNNDLLISLISPDVTEETWGTRLNLTDKPEAKVLSVDYAQSVNAALTSRPEIRAAKKEIEKRDIALVYYKNSSLPSLNLFATLSLNGVRGEASDTAPIRDEPEDKVSPYVGGWGETISDSASGDFYDYAIGVKLSIPIGSRASKAQLAQAGFSVEEAALGLKRLERDIIVEVRNAVRDITNGKKRVEAAQAARKLAEERLSAELVKFEAGASTSFTTLEYQKDLTVQKNNELLAVAGLKKAEARYFHATGEALDKAGLSLE